LSYGLPNNLQVYTGNLVFLAVRIPSSTAGTTGGSQTYNYIGLGQTATINEDADLQAASGVGDNRVKQWVPGMARVTVSITDMALITQSMESLGQAPSRSFTDLLSAQTFDILILDQFNTTGTQPLKTITDCSFANSSIQISKHVPITISGTLNGIDISGSMIRQ
jgi:hypothetical protein